MKHNLSEWFPTEPDFELFGIVSHLKDYRVCWMLNEILALELKRIDDFQEEKEKPEIPCYAQFIWEDEINHREIYLIANQPILKSAMQVTGTLFETEKLELLIPEKPKVDYFLKLHGQFNNDELTELEQHLNSINGISMAQRINPSTLKHFAHLIH
ncbi:IPExxxVDY family protein [Bacteroidota bacterium]